MRPAYKHCVLIVALAGSCADAAAADVYPVKSIRIVIGFSPGGYIDLTSRLVAGPLSAALRQQVVVDNRSGAGGVVGTEMAARARPRGHTLPEGNLRPHPVHQTVDRKLS